MSFCYKWSGHKPQSWFDLSILCTMQRRWGPCSLQNPPILHPRTTPHTVPGALFNSSVHHGDPLCANLKGEHRERPVTAAWGGRGSSQHRRCSSQQGPAAICSPAFPRTSRQSRPGDAGCQQKDATGLLPPST